MAGYHRFVFDIEGRKFVGDFEGMYRSEAQESFDSWHQEDSRQLNRRLALHFFDSANFHSVIDIGCGKGSLTHQFKRRNNRVVGVDVSTSAVEVARARFPDVDFVVRDMGSPGAISELADEFVGTGGKFDLAVIAECLSYVDAWKTMLNELSSHSRFLILTLYLPEDPIGFVKSPDELLAAVSSNWECLEVVSLHRSRFTVVFAESRNNRGGS
jgi:SAM-dependent methyltransferase